MPKRKTSTSFKPGQSGNPNGRPPKSVHIILLELKELGLSPMQPREIKDVFAHLLAADEQTILNIAEDKSKPMVLRLSARELLSNRAFDVMLEMMNRIAGKPKTEESAESQPTQIIIKRES